MDLNGGDGNALAERLVQIERPAHGSQHQGDDQDYAEYANPAARTVVGKSVITSAQTAEQDQLEPVLVAVRRSAA